MQAQHIYLSRAHVLVCMLALVYNFSNEWTLTGQSFGVCLCYKPLGFGLLDLILFSLPPLWPGCRWPLTMLTMYAVCRMYVCMRETRDMWERERDRASELGIERVSEEKERERERERESERASETYWESMHLCIMHIHKSLYSTNRFHFVGRTTNRRQNTAALHAFMNKWIIMQESSHQIHNSHHPCKSQQLGRKNPSSHTHTYTHTQHTHTETWEWPENEFYTLTLLPWRHQHQLRVGSYCI